MVFCCLLLRVSCAAEPNIHRIFAQETNFHIRRCMELSAFSGFGSAGFFLRLLSGDIFCGRWNRSWLGIVSFLFGGKSLERQFAGCGFSNKSLAQEKVFQFRFERGRKVA